MSGDTTRFRVFVNPPSGNDFPLAFYPIMGTRKRITIEPIEAILRANVKAVLKKDYQGKPGNFSRKHKNVRLSRIQDIDKFGACTMATLGRVANAVGLKPYQLLIPNLNVKDPQVAVKAREAKAIQLVQGDNSDEEANGG